MLKKTLSRFHSAPTIAWVRSVIVQTHPRQQFKGYERQMPQLAQDTSKVWSLEAPRVLLDIHPALILFFAWVVTASMREKVTSPSQALLWPNTAAVMADEILGYVYLRWAEVPLQYMFNTTALRTLISLFMVVAWPAKNNSRKFSRVVPYTI